MTRISLSTLLISKRLLIAMVIMRVSPNRRRRWNNILMLSVIAFIAVINLLTVIKSYLLPIRRASFQAY